jgi:hypothetical protein
VAVGSHTGRGVERLEYLVEGTKYILHYSDLKEDYLRYKGMTDKQFLKSLVPALHFVCIVSYLKEAPAYVLLSDEGLIHQMVHLLDKNTKSTVLPKLKEIREQFDLRCALA